MAAFQAVSARSRLATGPSACSTSVAASSTNGTSWRRRAAPRRELGPLRPMHATRRPARSRIGAERDMRPSSSSSTISAQPRRLTRRSSDGEPGEGRHRSGCQPSGLGFVEPCFELARAQLGEDELPGGRCVQRDVGSDPADDAEAVCRIELGDDLHRGAARDDGKKRRLVGTVAEPAQRPVRSLDQRAVGIGAAREPKQLVADHPPGRRLGDEPSVGERPERAADRRSRLPGRARERGRRGRFGRLGHRGEDVDRPVERDGSGDSSYCSSDEQSRQSDDQVASSTDADRLRHPHRVRDDRRPDPVPRRADRRARAPVGHERARDADVPLEPPCGLDPPRPVRARGGARCELRLHVARHVAHASPRPLRRRRRSRRARRGRRVLGAPERAARGPALQRLQRLAAGELARSPSLDCGG